MNNNNLRPDQALQMLSQMVARAPMSLAEHLQAQEAVKVLGVYLNTPKKEATDGDRTDKLHDGVKD